MLLTMDRFVTNYNRFYEEVKTITPDLFSSNKFTLPTEDLEKLDFFVRNWFPHMEHVSSANSKYFQEKKVSPEVFKNLKFLDLMEKVSNENKNIVWEYLHTLYALSMTNKPTKENYLVENAKDDEKELFEAIQKTINDFPVFVGNMVSWKRDKKAENTRVPKPKIDEKFMENSTLAKLAKEISDDINPAELLGINGDAKNLDPMKLLQGLMSDDKNNNNVGKLMSTVCEKVKTKMDSGEVNQEEIFKEAVTLMQSLGGGGIPGMPGGTAGAPGAGGPDLAALMRMVGGGGATGAGGPDLAGLMSMAQNLSAMGDLFGAQPGSSRGRSRKMKRRMKRKLKKKHK